jgi:hypothetical protein
MTPPLTTLVPPQHFNTVDLVLLRSFPAGSHITVQFDLDGHAGVTIDDAAALAFAESLRHREDFRVEFANRTPPGPGLLARLLGAFGGPRV